MYRRDGWKCQWPGCALGVNTFPFRRIEAHHIEPWRKRPDLFYDLNNGIVLCKKHHKAITGDEERHSSFFRGILKHRGALWPKKRQLIKKAETAARMRRSRRGARTAKRRYTRRRKRTGQ